MMTHRTMTRESVEAAEPLDFPAPQQGKEPIDYTVSGMYQGYQVTVQLTGRPEVMLPQIVKRLAELGIEPMQTAPRATQARPAHVEPVTNASGERCCPHHARPLKGPNQWGKLYCTARDEAGQYCKFTVKA